MRFEPTRAYTLNETGAPHAWDLRANWRDADPACSAIMTRSYHDFNEFPVWFFNLPPASESWPGPLDRPPGATTRMTIRGFLNVRHAGVLRIATSSDIAAVTSIDGEAKEGDRRLDPGIHRVAVDATLRGDRWQLRAALERRRSVVHRDGDGQTPVVSRRAGASMAELGPDHPGGRAAVRVGRVGAGAGARPHRARLDGRRVGLRWRSGVDGAHAGGTVGDSRHRRCGVRADAVEAPEPVRRVSDGRHSLDGIRDRQ